MFIHLPGFVALSEQHENANSPTNTLTVDQGTKDRWLDAAMICDEDSRVNLSGFLQAAHMELGSFMNPAILEAVGGVANGQTPCLHLKNLPVNPQVQSAPGEDVHGIHQYVHATLGHILGADYAALPCSGRYTHDLVPSESSGAGRSHYFLADKWLGIVMALCEFMIVGCLRAESSSHDEAVTVFCITHLLQAIPERVQKTMQQARFRFANSRMEHVELADVALPILVIDTSGNVKLIRALYGSISVLPARYDDREAIDAIECFYSAVRSVRNRGLAHEISMETGDVLICSKKAFLFVPDSDIVAKRQGTDRVLDYSYWMSHSAVSELLNYNVLL